MDAINVRNANMLACQRALKKIRATNTINYKDDNMKQLPKQQEKQKQRTADPMSEDCFGMPCGVCSFFLFFFVCCSVVFVTCYDLTFSRCSQIHVFAHAGGNMFCKLMGCYWAVYIVG